MKATRLCDGYGLDTAVMAPLILWLIDCYHEGLISEKDTGLPPARAGSIESQILSAITGQEIDEAGLNLIGERIFNLQRAILLCQGWGGRKGDRILDYFFEEPLKKGEVFFNLDGLMPGAGDEIISRIGAVVNRNEFEEMKSEYYELRGWDLETGFPTEAKLEALGLADVSKELEKTLLPE
jgi:aldehyde:ferredoxin oxidoreductase